jgi:methylated-DNA-[protein]-cysteine S-methyltransferase
MYFKTRFGFFYLEATEKGLYRVDFSLKQSKAKSYPERFAHSKVLFQTKSLLMNYLKGKPVSFRKLKLDISDYGPFEKRVLKALSRIDYADKQTYADMAKKVGSPRAARAVGSVMRKNRLPIVLPCHRVICSSGKLGGYAKGIAWKRRFLQMEAKGLKTERGKEK